MIKKSKKQLLLWDYLCFPNITKKNHTKRREIYQEISQILDENTCIIERLWRSLNQKEEKEGVEKDFLLERVSSQSG